jgi:PAS domain S-box-containing protein
LNTIIHQLVSVLDEDLVCQRAVDLIGQEFGYPHVAIFVLKKSFLYLQTDLAPQHQFLPRDYCQPVEEGIMGWAATHNQTALSNNVATDPRYVAMGNTTTQSKLSVPLCRNKKLWGVLDIQSPRPDSFSGEDVAAIETLADFIGVALENARVHRLAQYEIIDRMDADRALQASEERFRQVVASISAHVYVTEVTQSGALINHYISPNVQGLTGYAHARFLADHSFWPRRVIYAEDRPLAEQQLAALKTGQSSNMEYRLLRGDGRTIWVRDSGRVERQGTSLMIYGVVSDITDQKKAEQALVYERGQLAKRVDERTSELSAANAKLARVARLKDEFLANMSHELRTPLNAILGMSEVLQSGVYGDLTPEQQNAAHHIEESGRHLLALITDILDLSKIEAEKLELDIGPVFLDLVCESSLRMVAQIARKKHVSISSEFDERVVSIQADQRRLKQILVNLLSNAVKFTPESGQIGLYVQGDQEQELVRFIVWDTGVGIAKENLSQLFRPFVQLDSKLSREHEGSGLGLSLVAKLAELHGGGVAVESEPGQGSRFIVSLPWLAADHQMHLQTDTGSAADLKSHILNLSGSEPPLILLAEDNEANVIIVTEFLESMEYRVIVCRNGQEAIDQTIESRPNLILMDIQMPDVDGLEAIRVIRSTTAVSQVPIIALTALAMPGDRERCLKAGANDYLSKPVSLRNLVQTIEALLNQTL